VLRVECTQPGGVQTLNRSEHVIEALRTKLADPQLAEVCVPQGVSKCRPALLENLLPVRYKQHTRS
jgi:hypothetical protein